jgi:transcriptional regulator with XRE-family HTH domain
MTPDELRAARLQLGLTQEQFAAALDVSQEHVHRLEKGKKPIGTTFARAVTQMLGNWREDREYPRDGGPIIVRGWLKHANSGDTQYCSAVVKPTEAPEIEWEIVARRPIPDGWYWVEYRPRQWQPLPV